MGGTLRPPKIKKEVNIMKKSIIIITAIIITITIAKLP
ncbi:hypothetical protein Javan64_0057 [Streptococcus phage Javan64]|nr:hypothetical protein Javan64_0057 [Streptococcus phage Javan64]